MVMRMAGDWGILPVALRDDCGRERGRRRDPPGNGGPLEVMMPAGPGSQIQMGSLLGGRLLGQMMGLRCVLGERFW